MPPEDPPFRPSPVAPPEPAGAVRWFVFRGRRLLVTRDGRLPDKTTLDRHVLAPERTLYLGALGEIDCYAAQVAPEAAAPDGLAYRDLMTLFATLPQRLHSLAGRAVQLLEWDRTHAFCGACGGPTQPAERERARICSECGLSQFPRLAPAVIATIERGDEILLARSPHFPPGIYSTIAGFIEPGESAEQTLAREVREEVGVEIGAVRYFGSQPWPFPNSLMLGFTAEWRGGEIRIDDDEIEDARWFHCDDMPMRFGGKVSIAQWLMDDFVRRRRGDG